MPLKSRVDARVAWPAAPVGRSLAWDAAGVGTSFERGVAGRAKIRPISRIVQNKYTLGVNNYLDLYLMRALRC